MIVGAHDVSDCDTAGANMGEPTTKTAPAAAKPASKVVDEEGCGSAGAIETTLKNRHIECQGPARTNFGVLRTTTAS
jgi:hypothetical protein